MQRLSVVLVASLALACSTHRVDDCRPACTDADQTLFARCVATGSGVCQAGNRRCCAVDVAHCIGRLDDQTVETTRTDCVDRVQLMAAACEPPCDSSADDAYQFCMIMPEGICPPGDDECCALSAHCLGDVGDYTVYADGCCANALDDCNAGELCDYEWTCQPGPGCGDGIQQTSEQCDDGNQSTEEVCDYGPMSCTLCTESCMTLSGAPQFCGDLNIQSDEGEECDPPMPGICDASCQSLLPDTCTNHVHDPGETGPDCGGDICAPCGVQVGCLLDTDCGFDPICGPLTCTGAGMTCLGTDIDGDQYGPRFECGLDCNDDDPNINPDALEICDRIDQDCDDLIDEMCS